MFEPYRLLPPYRITVPVMTDLLYPAGLFQVNPIQTYHISFLCDLQITFFPLDLENKRSKVYSEKSEREVSE